MPLINVEMNWLFSMWSNLYLSVITVRFGTDVTPGDVVQVNATYDAVRGCYTVDHSDPDSSIVIHPDTLISGTTVASSITCIRK